MKNSNEADLEARVRHGERMLANMAQLRTLLPSLGSRFDHDEQVERQLLREAKAALAAEQAARVAGDLRSRRQPVLRFVNYFHVELGNLERTVRCTRRDFAPSLALAALAIRNPDGATIAYFGRTTNSVRNSLRTYLPNYVGDLGFEELATALRHGLHVNDDGLVLYRPTPGTPKILCSVF